MTTIYKDKDGKTVRIDKGTRPRPADTPTAKPSAPAPSAPAPAPHSKKEK